MAEWLRDVKLVRGSIPLSSTSATVWTSSVWARAQVPYVKQEHLVDTWESGTAGDVARSTPWGGRYKTVRGRFLRGVAQLVARVLWEHEVAGSSPVTPTMTTPFGVVCDMLV